MINPKDNYKLLKFATFPNMDGCVNSRTWLAKVRWISKLMLGSARENVSNQNNSMLGDICFCLAYTKQEVANSKIDICHRKSTCLKWFPWPVGHQIWQFRILEIGKSQPEIFRQSVPSHDSSAKNFQPRFPMKRFNFYGSGCGVVAESRCGLGGPRWWRPVITCWL